MAKNKKVEILSHDGQVLHPITDGDCVIFPDGETLTHKLSEDEAVMYTPEVVNSSPMFKVGEGDSSDYSANVLDGAYQEAVLKGQTYVNTIQEPSADVITLPTPFTEYERTQSKTFTEMQDGTFGLNLVGQSYVNCIQEPSEHSYVALGENLEFQNKKVEYTTDGQIKSAMLNGMTLVNLSPEKKRTVTSTTDSYEWRNTQIDLTNYVQASKTYLIKIGNYSSSGANFATPNEVIFQTANSGERGVWFKDQIIYTVPNEFNPILDINSKILLRIHACMGTAIDNTVIADEIMLIEYQKGMENWDIPYFQGMQSVTMSTELENVCSRYNSSTAKNGKTFTIGSINDRTLKLADVAYIGQYNFKPNTKYLIQFKITNLNLDGLSSTEIRFYTSTLESGNCLFENGSHVKVSKNGIYRAVFTTTSVINTSSFEIKGVATEWENSTSIARKLTISQIMCIEYQNGMENWDLPYFETTQLMKPLKVQSINKNILNIPLTYKVAFQGGERKVWSDYWGTEEYIRVQPNTTYTFSNSLDKPIYYGIVFYNRAKQVVYWQNNNIGKTFTTTSDTYYVRFSLNSPETSKPENCQLEISDVATNYTPHQEKTTSALEPITLRAIGNVKDTLDLSTGEYVQRIGEIVLDGSDDEIWYPSGLNQDLINAGRKNLVFYYNHENNGTLANLKLSPYSEISNIISDKLARIAHKEQVAANVIYDFPSITGGISVPELRIAIPVENSTAQQDSATCKTWLKENPIKVQYELANPITRKISLEYPNLQTYTDITHVQSIAMDGTLIPKIFLPSDISYKAMLKPNTSYNVIVDREVIDSTNQLTVNLGGTTANITANRTVVRTPSTLSNETLTFSGKDNRLAKAMLIEGGTLINGDLPHFDGIGDVKLGRVVENLCMSNEYPEGNGRTTDTYSNNSITSKFTASGSRVYLFDLIKPIQNGKKYFVHAPCSQTCSIGFKTIYNGTALYSVAKTSIDNYTILSIDNEILRECRLFIGQLGAMPVNTTMTIRRPIICEYIEGMENWDWESIGYFTGTKNIGNEFMRIGNKNLFGEVVNRYWDAPFTNSNETIRPVPRDNAYSVRNIKVKKGRTYTASGNGFTRSVIAYFKTNSIDELPFDGSLQNFNYTFTSKYDGYVEWYLSNDNVNNPVTNVQIEEASSATSYVAHKHNSLHILPDKQIPLTFEQGRIDYTNNGTWANAINNTSTQVIRTQLLDLEPNETYRVSCGHSDFMFAVGLYNNSLLGSSVISYTSDRERYITTTKDVHKIGIATMRKDSTNITPSVLHQVRLEKITDVTLRSVGNVKDELDLTRGVYIQRIGEIVLNGLEQWKLCTSAYQPTDTNYLNYDLDVNRIKTSVPILCDTIKTRDWTIPSTEINSRSISAHSTNKFLRLCIEKTIAPDVESLKTYLSTNMVKVQYQLTTPIEHKINIPMKNESNKTIAKPNGIFTLPLMYSETNHVNINSQIYPKVQPRDYISYPVIASPSNKYTVFHNKVGSTDLTVNLCGASTTVNTHKNTITTPSSISQYELRLSSARNKVSNVCVFSGDYMNVNVPYVQGMMNAVNPIVKNIGKNLIDFNNIYTNHVANGRLSIDKINQTIIGTNDYNDVQFYVYLVQGKTYTFNASGTFSQGSPLQLLRGKIQGYQEYALVNTFNNNTTLTHKTETGWYTLHIVNIRSMYNIQLKESSTPSQYEPYKENICVPDYGQIKLTKDMFEQGSFNELSSVKNYYETKTSTSHNLQLKRIRLIDPIPVKPNTKYIVKFNGLEDYDVFVAYFKDNERVGFEGYWKNKEFTTPSDCNQIVFVLKRKGDAQILVDDIDYSKLIFSKVDETIHLRSLPNGVRDELNLETGQYVQRIGEINIRDLSKMDNMVRKGGWDNGTYMSFDIITPDAVQNKTNAIITASNLFPTVIRNLESSESMKEFVTNTASGNLFVMIRKDRLLSADLNGFKQWLEDNDLVIQYELATPVIKQVDIHNYPHSYKDGHVIIESNDPSTNVTAQLTYQCVTNRSGQIQEHTEQVEKQERQINELETLILENIRLSQNRSQNFLTSLISTLEIEEE